MAFIPDTRAGESPRSRKIVLCPFCRAQISLFIFLFYHIQRRVMNGFSWQRNQPFLPPRSLLASGHSCSMIPTHSGITMLPRGAGLPVRHVHMRPVFGGCLRVDQGVPKLFRRCRNVRHVYKPRLIHRVPPQVISILIGSVSQCGGGEEKEQSDTREICGHNLPTKTWKFNQPVIYSP